MATTTIDTLREEYLATGRAAHVFENRTARIDLVVKQAYDWALAAGNPSGLALLAVGGYGRCELFPQSDVDLLLLVDRPVATAAAKGAISEFLRILWDSNMRLSHSVHTVTECCELDERNAELSISLLDQRLLAGDDALYAQLQQKLPKFFHAQKLNLVKHLSRLTRARHLKFNGTIYHLEPNIKETPGGLRDFHLICWLHKLGGVKAEWLGPLEPSRDFLALARCHLHFQSGRDNNLLSFEMQDEIAALPFQPTHDPGQWMREYFRHARAIHRAALRGMDASEAAASTLLRQFRDWRSRLSNSEFTVSQDRVLFRMPSALESDPPMGLRLFEFVARHGVHLALDSERRIEESLPALEAAFAGARNVWPQFIGILSLPHAALALRSMHETGFLRTLIPEWARIECLVVRDFYHRYTVDEHTLVAIETLEQIAESKEPAMRRYVDLLRELENPALLRVALLFHDIGKGSGKEHAGESVRLAREAMARLGAPAEQIDFIIALVERHLELSSMMTSRDLGDAGSAMHVAERAGTLERLKYLTILTYADIAAVNPTAMTPWRLEQLWRVYLLGHQELTRELDTDRIHSPAVGSPDMARFLEGFPTRYVRTHSEAQIRAHFELSKLAQLSALALDLARHNGTYVLTLLAKDRPGLFSSVAGTLASFGMNILKAEAFANQARLILDTFTFSDPMRTLELNPTETDRLRRTVADVVLGKVDVRTLLRGRRPPALKGKPKIETRVAFDSDTSETATLIEIITEDRPGLLYDLSSAISASGCNIEVVLIDTEAHKALDVFYVTSAGLKLNHGQQLSLETRLVAACGAERAG